MAVDWRYALVRTSRHWAEEALLKHSGIIIAAVVALMSIFTSPAALAGDSTGFYAGLDTFYVDANVSYANPGTPVQKLSGDMLGVTAGFDYKLANGVVIGIGADAAFGNLSTMVRDGNYIVETGKIDAMYGVHARAGYDFGAVMPYVTAGFTAMNLTQGESCPLPAAAPFGFCHTHGPFDVSQSQLIWGTTVGAGVEIAVADNMSLTAEVDHHLFSPVDFNLSPDGNGNPLPTSTAFLGANSVKVGFHVKF